MQGARVDEYVLGEQLGRAGGMGSVWEARDAHGNVHALKLMHAHAADDPDLVQRFRREFEIGRHFNHPALVRMVSSGTVNGIPYLVMELAPGKTVRRLLERGGPFREEQVLRICANVAGGLAALHGGHVVHRDLSATNVMVARDLSAKVIDYGIARLMAQDNHTPPGGFMGKAEYAAPEIYYGRDATPATDIYSLGVLMFEMLTGQVPFRARTYVDVLKLHATSAVPSPRALVPVLTPETDALVRAMLDKTPSNRPSAATVALRCQQILAAMGKAMPPPPQAAYRPLVSPARDLSAAGMPLPAARQPARDRGAAAAWAIAVGAVGTAAVAAALLVAATGGQ